MNSTDSFCYALAVKAAKRKADLVNLLAEEKRTAVENALREMEDIPKDAIRLRWKRGRLDELTAQRRRVKERLGGRVEKIAPLLQAWLTRPF